MRAGYLWRKSNQDILNAEKSLLAEGIKNPTTQQVLDRAKQLYSTSTWLANKAKAGVNYVGQSLESAAINTVMYPLCGQAATAGKALKNIPGNRASQIAGNVQQFRDVNCSGWNVAAKFNAKPPQSGMQQPTMQRQSNGYFTSSDVPQPAPQPASQPDPWAKYGGNPFMGGRRRRRRHH